jgi:hypothetical protein
VREKPAGPVDLLPIPANLRPILDALRLAVTGDAEGIVDKFAVDLLPYSPGWHIRLAPRAPAAPPTTIGFFGCGNALQVIEISQEGGVRRVLTLERQ